MQDLFCLQSLESLDLSYCRRISAKSLQVISQIPRLKKISLAHCDQLRGEEDALLELATQCFTLEEIDLAGIGCYPSFASELASKMPAIKRGVLLGSEYPPINTWRGADSSL